MKKFFDKLVCSTAEEFYERVHNAINKSEKMFIVTANPETFMLSKSNSEFGNLLERDVTTIIPDGIGIVKASHYFGIPVKERITGVELTYKLLQYADELNKSVYLYGAEEKVISALVEYISKNYPNIKISGYKNGYKYDESDVFQDIKNTRPDIVLIALGIPKQEIIINKHIDEFDKGIFVGVGGTFDVLSGYKKRAPEIFIKLNIEWLYRLCKEPKRLKRFYNNNIKFIFFVRKMKKEYY